MRKRQTRMDPIELDGSDRAIVQCLLGDARKAISTISKDLGMSESTVRSRLKRLMARGLIQFDITTDPYQFGYSVWAMLEIHVELPKIREVVELISREPRIHMIGIMSGAYDIFAATVVRSNWDLVELITNRLSKIPGITRVSSSTILEVVKRGVNFGFPESVYEGISNNTRSQSTGSGAAVRAKRKHI